MPARRGAPVAARGPGPGAGARRRRARAADAPALPCPRRRRQAGERRHAAARPRGRLHHRQLRPPVLGRFGDDRRRIRGLQQPGRERRRQPRDPGAGDRLGIERRRDGLDPDAPNGRALPVRQSVRRRRRRLLAEPAPRRLDLGRGRRDEARHRRQEGRRLHGAGDPGVGRRRLPPRPHRLPPQDGAQRLHRLGEARRHRRLRARRVRARRAHRSEEGRPLLEDGPRPPRCRRGHGHRRRRRPHERADRGPGRRHQPGRHQDRVAHRGRARRWRSSARRAAGTPSWRWTTAARPTTTSTSARR